MRRRLIGASVAVTTMVVLAFLIPLGLLVRDLAHDRAASAAERDAEAIALFLAVVGPTRGVEQTISELGLESLSRFDVSVVLADGTVVGQPVPAPEDPIGVAQGMAVRIQVPGGESVYVPVLQADGTRVVVRVFVESAILAKGVAVSWLTLGLLGLLLVSIAVFVSDRLARSIVGSVEDLSAVASELGDGNLDARVVPSGPKEVRRVGGELNRLAGRVEQLLQQERETAADLSHRLRTPITALRLDAESLPPGPRRDRLVDDVDDLTRHVDFVISEARREVRRTPGVHCDLVRVVRDRLAFWGPLADEQGRRVETSIADDSDRVLLPEEDVRAMVDALLGNIFAHTPDGTPISIALAARGDLAVLAVEDGGPGFSSTFLVERGASGSSGTGLGLDIARRTAESVGGTFTIGRGDRLGGALVVVELPREG